MVAIIELPDLASGDQSSKPCQVPLRIPAISRIRTGKLDQFRGALDFSARCVSGTSRFAMEKIKSRFLKLGLIPKAINVKDIVWNWTPGS